MWICYNRVWLYFSFYLSTIRNVLMKIDMSDPMIKIWKTKNNSKLCCSYFTSKLYSQSLMGVRFSKMCLKFHFLWHIFTKITLKTWIRMTGFLQFYRVVKNEHEHCISQAWLLNVITHLINKDDTSYNDQSTEDN